MRRCKLNSHRSYCSKMHKGSFRPFAFKMPIGRVAPSRVTRHVYYCPYLKRLAFATWKKLALHVQSANDRENVRIGYVSFFARTKRNSAICHVWFNVNSLPDKWDFDSDLIHGSSFQFYFWSAEYRLTDAIWEFSSFMSIFINVHYLSKIWAHTLSSD